MKQLGLTVIIILLAQILLAYSNLNNIDGDYINVFDARIMGMGNCSLTDTKSVFGKLENPGTTLEKQGLSLQLSFLMHRYHEDRTLPMYNGFDAYTSNATYASNLNYFGNVAIGVIYNMKQINLANFSLNFLGGLIYSPYIDLNANYEEEVRNNDNSNYDSYPDIIAHNYIESEGGIESINLLLHTQINEKTSFGINIRKFIGKSDYEKRIEWSDFANTQVDSLPIYNTQCHRKFDGIGFNTGFLYQFSKRLEIGISFSNSVDFEVQGNINDLALNKSVRYYLGTKIGEEYIIKDSVMYDKFITPSSFGIGIKYKPRNIMKTEFSFQVKVVNWNDVSKIYDPVLDFYLGVEHCLENKLPFRFGLKYETNYYLIEYNGFVESNKLTSPAFTFGTGYEIYENFYLDFSGELGMRKYDSIDMFGDSIYNYEELWGNYTSSLRDRGWENPDTIEETYFKTNISLSINY